MFLSVLSSLFCFSCLLRFHHFLIGLNLKICMHETFCIFNRFDQISTSKCLKSLSCVLELMTANRWPTTNFYSIHLKPNFYSWECHCSSKNSIICSISLLENLKFKYLSPWEILAFSSTPIFQLTSILML